jgi:hypothetical protein
LFVVVVVVVVVVPFLPSEHSIDLLELPAPTPTRRTHYFFRNACFNDDRLVSCALDSFLFAWRHVLCIVDFPFKNYAWSSIADPFIEMASFLNYSLQAGMH